jgi:hypothetical protein
MINKSVKFQIYELMSKVANNDGAEHEIEKITNKHGKDADFNSIKSRITNIKNSFPMWNFYTRTCPQTDKKIIGAKKAEVV